MTFKVPIDPADIPTSQQKGVRVVNGVPMFYKRKPLLDFERRFMHHMDELRNGYRIPDKEAIYLHVAFAFGYPKSTPKSRQLDMAPMTERPDGDNLAKAVIDCLGDRYAKDKKTGKWYVAHTGFFADDAAISPLVISKFRTTSMPCVMVTILPRYKWREQVQKEATLG